MTEVGFSLIEEPITELPLLFVADAVEWVDEVPTMLKAARTHLIETVIDPALVHVGLVQDCGHDAHFLEVTEEPAFVVMDETDPRSKDWLFGTRSDRIGDPVVVVPRTR